MSKVAIQGNASGTGVFTIASPNSNTDRTLTLPDEAGTVVVTGTTPALNGVTFPASQVTSADANTLDDYEEGTWTPVVTDGSGSVSISGSYRKIGDIVWVQIDGYNVNYSAVGTGNLQITGFPFTGGGGQQPFPTNDPNNNGPYALEVSGTTSYIWRTVATSTDYYFTSKSTLGISTTGSIRGTIVYRTA